MKELTAYIEFKGKLYLATDWYESSIDSRPYVFL